MNGPRLMLLVRQGLCHLCFMVIVGAVVVGCTSTSSSSSNAPSSGPASPTATGTDTTSAKLNLASGTGPGGGSNGLSVPVQASAYGSATSVPFMVNDSTLNVSYSYDCSSTGGSGFVAEMISGSPDNPGSDDEGIANESGTSDSATVTVNPQDTPGNYFLQVNSPCDWTIVVQNG